MQRWIVSALYLQRSDIDAESGVHAGVRRVLVEANASDLSCDIGAELDAKLDRIVGIERQRGTYVIRPDARKRWRIPRCGREDNIDPVVVRGETGWEFPARSIDIYD